MAPTGDLRRLGMAAALVFLAATSLGAGGIVLWDWQTPKLPTESAEKRKQKWPIYCYDASNVQRKLDCSYLLELMYDPPDPLAIAWNGGHLHSEGRESSKLAMGDLTCDRFVSKTDTSCVGFTEGTIVNVTHEIPEVSGILTTRITQTFPPGWICADFSECDDETHRTWFLTLYTSIGIPGLVELPASDQYIRCGKADQCFSDNQVFDAHPFPFMAKPKMANAARLLAERYRAAHPGVKLRILDLSLPNGGLMEDNPDGDQWAPPHYWHRVGESVDIGLWAVSDDGQRVDFEPGELVDELAQLVEENDLPLRRVKEAGGNIHFQLKGGLNQ